jgi:hypothetical protein
VGERAQEPRDVAFTLKGAGGDGGELIDVVAGREHVAFAPDHDRSYGLIRFRGYDGIRERAIHDICQRVLLVGPRECQRQDVIRILYLDLFGHSSSPLGNFAWRLANQRATISISTSVKPSLSRAFSPATPALDRASPLRPVDIAALLDYLVEVGANRQRNLSQGACVRASRWHRLVRFAPDQASPRRENHEAAIGSTVPRYASFMRWVSVRV